MAPLKHGVSIRTSLTLLVLATALPFVTLIAYNAYSQARVDAEEASAEALRAAKSVATDTEDTLRRAQQLLSALSKRTAVRSLDPAHCAPIFGAFIELYPEYTNLLTVRRNGDRVCSAVQPTPGAPARVDPQLYLAETLRSRAFTVGQLTRGIFTGHWITIVAHPFMDERDEIQGIVAVAIDLTTLRLVPRPAELPQEAIARVVDSRGTVIASSIAPEKWIGQSLADVPWFKRLEPGRAATGRSVDVEGMERIFGTVPIGGTTWHAAVGIPVDVVFATGRSRLMLSAALSLVALALAAALAYLTARRTVRPIEKIAAAAWQATYASPGLGRELAHAAISAPREIRTLASDLRAMLEARAAAELQLRESEELFRQFAENIRDAIYLLDPIRRKYLYTSPAFDEIWGRSRALLESNPTAWTEAIHPDDRERVRASFAQLPATGTYSETFRIVHPDGGVRWIRSRGFPILDASGKLYRVAGISEDVTESKMQQDRIERLTRVYAVLSGINSLLVRVRDRDELFREACRIAVAEGRFRLAWAGVVDRQEMRVKPVAWAGAAEGFVEHMRLRLMETTPESQGLVWSAVRERKPAIANDMRTDPRVALKAEAQARGFRSFVVLPLVVSGETEALLALYADAPGFFDEEEMKLLVELSGDVAFALQNLQRDEKLNYLAYYDPLTGLANRSLFHERLEQFVHAAGRDQRSLALLVLDVERFTIINDSLGRQAGDELLRQVAARLSSYTGDATRLARLSADHFAAVIPDAGGEDAVARRIERTLRACFGEPFVIEGQQLRVSARMGASIFPGDGESADTRFRNGEAALKKAKASGERYLFYAQQMNERTAEKLALENKLRQALEKDEFVLHYQPKVNSASGRIEGVEALIRWENPGVGLVPPGDFIPLMEETGLILEVGAWALRQAVLDHQRWAKLVKSVPRIAVNVSPIQLRQRNFVETVKLAIAEAGLSECGIDLEITESLIMEDVAGSIGKLGAVSELGMEIAIDDFGTGYSSLGYLAKLPVNSLKIDRSFIIKMMSDPDTMTLVSTIISLAHSLRLSVVAEGVDSEDQAKMLRLLRCDQMQGYLFNKPLPFDQVTGLLQREEARAIQQN